MNFDLPTSSRLVYMYHVGCTARAGRTGIVSVIRRFEGKNKVVGCLPSAANDDAVFAKVEKEQGVRSWSKIMI